MPEDTAKYVLTIIHSARDGADFKVETPEQDPFTSRGAAVQRVLYYLIKASGEAALDEAQEVGRELMETPGREVRHARTGLTFRLDEASPLFPTDVPRETSDPVRRLRQWHAELEGSTKESHRIRREIIGDALNYIDEKHATIRRLNERAQEKEKVVNTVRRSVEDWNLNGSHSHVTLDSIVGIAQAVGAVFDPDRFDTHYRQVKQLQADLCRYEGDMPSWTDAVPEDYDAWLRDLVPDRLRLPFYQWIGALAVEEAVEKARENLYEDPAPAEYRSYGQDTVSDFFDEMKPKNSGPYPSALPVGRPFCDVAWHVHLDGADRLPTCRLDSP